MDGVRHIRTIRLDGMLSYAPGTPELALEPVNVLIGPNGSGKSNLIEALSLLRAAPNDLQMPIREGGGVGEWMWKGAPERSAATLDVTVDNPYSTTALRYRLSFSELWAKFVLGVEAVESERPLEGGTQPYVYYRYPYQEGRPVINVSKWEGGRQERKLEWIDINPENSILSQRRDPLTYPELTYLTGRFTGMAFYREFQVGPRTPPRLPQQADLPHHFLLDDASNLGLVLSDLLNQPAVRQQLLERLRDFYPSINEVVAGVQGGTVQIFFHEEGLRHPVPATRVSDGSLRYLCLLAVLLHPNPPSIVCIEEPEIGLHPDVIPELAKLILEASTRCQIFVTTHSDILVDALSEVPESVLVCEKSGSATQLRRLDGDELRPWLEEYRLGELWIRGRFGGNRW